MSSLLDEIRAQTTVRGPKCQFLTYVRNPHPEYADAAEQAFNEGLPRAAIYRWLRSKDINLGKHVIERHMNKECLCRP